MRFAFEKIKSTNLDILFKNLPKKNITTAEFEILQNFCKILKDEGYNTLIDLTIFYNPNNFHVRHIFHYKKQNKEFRYIEDEN